MIAEPPPAHGGVGEFAREAVVGQDKGPVDGEALGDVTGDRVPVKERRIPVDGGRREERTVERYGVAPELDDQPVLGSVDRKDATALAVRDAEPRVVGLDHDEVADGESAAGKIELRATERARRAKHGAGPPVEVGDVGASLGDHHRDAIALCRMPFAHEPLAGLGRRIGDTDPLVSDVQRDGQLGIAVAQLVERLALPFLALTAVLHQLDREAAANQGTEDAARGELGQLAVVADEHQLALRALDGVEQAGELPGGDHRGFVDDQDRAVREPGAVALDAGQQCGDARRRDAGIRLQLIGGAPRDRGTQDRPAGCLPCVPGEPAGEPRYRIIASVPEGQFNDERRQAIVAAVTEAVLDAEGGAYERDPLRVWVFANEIPDGTWGGGGRIVTLAAIAGFVLGDAEKGRAHAEKRLAGRRGAEIAA